MLRCVVVDFYCYVNVNFLVIMFISGALHGLFARRYDLILMI